MLIPVAVAVAVLALALASWAGVFAAQDRPVVLRQLWGAAVVEGALVVELAIAIVRALGGAEVPRAGLFWAYAVATLLVLPLAAAWAFAERTRWSSVVLLVAAVTIVFLQQRLFQVWGQA